MEVLFVMASSFLLFIILLNLVFNSLFHYPTSRISALYTKAQGMISEVISSKVCSFFLISMFMIIALSNVSGNIPGNYTPTQFYSVVMTVSLTLWVPILLSALSTDFKGFFAHMFPKGAPIWMIFLLPLVEFVSIMLRPLILVVRLCTNLAAGHILLYIFSYFTTLLSAASPLIGLLLVILFIMELFISLLQAYIFVNLITLYISDTLH